LPIPCGATCCRDSKNDIGLPIARIAGTPRRARGILGW
jgi:hypothetical protein